MQYANKLTSVKRIVKQDYFCISATTNEKQCITTMANNKQNIGQKPKETP